MRAILAILALLICTTGASYADDAKPAKHHKHHHRLKHHDALTKGQQRFDTNHDGKLDANERAAMKANHAHGKTK